MTGCGQHAATVRKDTWRFASTSLQIKTTCYDASTGIVFINVHENEATSLRAGKHFLSSVQQHCLVELQHSRRRLISFKHKGREFGIDPNRIFTNKGARATLRKHSAMYSEDALAPVRRIAERFARTYIDRKALVVALHNNTDTAYSINTYLSGMDAAAVFVNEEQDADDFFFTTEQSFFDFLSDRGYNVVLQHNEKAEDDGSLSIYCARRQIPYINIEAQEGHLIEQKRMLDLLQELIETVILPN